MNGSFLSGGLQLARYLVKPSGKTGALPAMVLCHGYPSGGIDARHSAGTFSELVDRVANELGWNAMTFTFRGCATSEGDFSMQGWVDDLRAAITHVVAETSPSGIWLVGNNTGGSLGLCVAADDPRVNGCALLGQISTTGPNNHVDSLNTRARLERYGAQVSRHQSRSGAES